MTITQIPGSVGLQVKSRLDENVVDEVGCK